jgi:hypothetical protein
MADNPVIVEGSAMDYAEHVRTYRLFVSLVKWGAIGCACILIFMAITLL